MHLTIKPLNTRTAALPPSVSQCRPELDMNFEISKSEHPHGKGYGLSGWF
jgi:hypothetical protein